MGVQIIENTNVGIMMNPYHMTKLLNLFNVYSAPPSFLYTKPTFYLSLPLIHIFYKHATVYKHFKFEKNHRLDVTNIIFINH